MTRLPELEDWKAGRVDEWRDGAVEEAEAASAVFQWGSRQFDRPTANWIYFNTMMSDE
ncbi:MAG: hypothetical protein NTV22_18050 [bacterium]|nr:hypothetical protein [bacterium]